jgi:hypothetical protein
LRCFLHRPKRFNGGNKKNVYLPGDIARERQKDHMQQKDHIQLVDTQDACVGSVKNAANTCSAQASRSTQADLIAGRPIP